MGKIEFTEDEMVEEIIEAKMKAAERTNGRKRTLVGKFPTYDRAKDAEADLINNGAEPTSVQVRRNSKGFGLFVRSWVK